MTSCTTSSGWETIATWFVATSTVVAPMRWANSRSASGGIAWSPWATRCQLRERLPRGDAHHLGERRAGEPCSWAVLAGTVGHSRSRFSCKSALEASKGVSGARACPRMPRLMYPSRTRGSLSVFETYNARRCARSTPSASADSWAGHRGRTGRRGIIRPGSRRPHGRRGSTRRTRACGRPLRRCSVVPEAICRQRASRDRPSPPGRPCRRREASVGRLVGRRDHMGARTSRRNACCSLQAGPLVEPERLGS